MYVVIFRARVAAPDPEYAQAANTLRQLALERFGCLEFCALSDGAEEIALSYWPDEASITAWKLHAQHVLAQTLGREKWYESYHVQVAEIRREYRFPGQAESGMIQNRMEK
jgi:heme-degrading monooxygenase HmoA